MGLEESSDDGDYDKDGILTLWEYLQGCDPTVADVDGSSIKSGVASFQGADYLVAAYPRQENLPPGVIVKLQCSMT